MYESEDDVSNAREEKKETYLGSVYLWYMLCCELEHCSDSEFELADAVNPRSLYNFSWPTKNLGSYRDR